jgi:cell division protein FtsI/penicillin-binding protein 2
LATEVLSDRRWRITHRALPALGAVAIVSLGAGLLVGRAAETSSERVAGDFARAWGRGDYTAMHVLLPPEARARYPLRTFRRAYERAASVATATGVRTGSPAGAGDGLVRVPVRVSTRIFGPLGDAVVLPVDEEAIAWAPHLVFPGLGEGESLRRRSEVPERAKITSADGKVLAEGPADARTSPLGEVGSSIAGSVAATEDRRERRALLARGFPADTPVGVSGLERAFQRDVEGIPGGQLLAGQRVLAQSSARAAGPARSTIDSRLQQAAVTALAGRLGGVAALDARTAKIRALAGIAISAPQPPGSTFKIVTTTAALEDRLVKPSDKFAVESRAVIDGVELENANGELCGGTFANSFAHSCNSVFAPLGVKVGAARLVEVAERYGFNEPPLLAGERPSTLPAAGEIVSPLEVGSTAIGQFKVLATTLGMASVAQTVANRGIRIRPTLRPRAPRRAVRVTNPAVAATLERLMEGVVAYGTGTSAAIPGVAVAGKTGTAELQDTRGSTADEQPSADPNNTDAWFTAFAPGRKPRIVVAVLLVRSGAGGTTAAPAARIVLGRALGK